jgi:hypothetical protein
MPTTIGKHGIADVLVDIAAHVVAGRCIDDTDTVELPAGAGRHLGARGDCAQRRVESR